MMFQTQHISTPKTARVVTFGELTEKTKLVWLVTHGYGFLAEFFIKKFDCLDPQEHFVVVPEALNRFYLQNMSGRVGASWMTTEDRENEIKDYILYLDNIYETLNLQKAPKIAGLGFSQGAATIARWFQQTKNHVDHLIFWGGTVPEDVLTQDKIKTMDVYSVIGDSDEFVTEAVKTKVMENYRNNNLTFSQIFYKGGHAIVTEPLMQLSAQLTLS
jgi:predicted esterase